MKNVTVSMDDAVLAWVRVKAARENTSVSRYLGQLIEQARARDSSYESAMRAALKFQHLPMPEGARYLSRAEAGNRAALGLTPTS